MNHKQREEDDGSEEEESEEPCRMSFERSTRGRKRSPCPNPDHCQGGSCKVCRTRACKRRWNAKNKHKGTTQKVARKERPTQEEAYAAAAAAAYDGVNGRNPFYQHQPYAAAIMPYPYQAEPVYYVQSPMMQPRAFAGPYYCNVAPTGPLYYQPQGYQHP